MPKNIRKKSFISIPKMINNIISKGISVDNKHAESIFKFINYYRFLPYIKYQTQSSCSPSNIDLCYIENRYKFDKKLRGILATSTENVENFVRNDITEYFRVSNKNFYSDFLNPTNQPISSFPNTSLIYKLQKSFTSTDNTAVKYYQINYGCNLTNIPIWVFVESLEFGTTIWILEEIKNFDEQNKKRDLINLIKNKYDIDYTNYIACLKSSKSLRNTCAHGNRIYYNTLNSSKPKYPSSWSFQKNKKISPQNTEGLYRKLIGLKSFYKNRQDSWLDFIFTLDNHFESNKEIVSYEDYYFLPDWQEVLLDGW